MLAAIALFTALALALTSGLAVVNGTRARVAIMKIDQNTPHLDDMTRMAVAERSLAITVQAARNAWAADPSGIFAFSDAEMSYYGRLPFISYFDPLAVPFYKEPTAESLWAALRQHEVRYVLSTQYPLAEITNTAFGALLANPQLTSVAFEHRGTRLIRLADAPLAVTRTIVAEEQGQTPHKSAWSAASFGNRGKDAPATIEFGNGAISMMAPSHDVLDWRRIDTMYRGALLNGAPAAFSLDPEKHYRLEVEVNGTGRVDLYFVFLSTDRALLRETWLWNAVLIGDKRTAAARFRPPSDAAVDPDGTIPMGFALRTIGNGNLTVSRWRLEALQ